ncbi:fructose-6-phosphate aldolase [bacterium]|nr:fructose-6-phosphate aldolase [bacterium]
MKIFLDTANIQEIKEAAQMGIIDGITTNPTLLAKESGKELQMIASEIIHLVDGPISLEVLSQKAEEMLEEGKRLFDISHKHVVIKVPMCEEGLRAIRMFAFHKIPTNCTLIFSANQGLLAAKAGATYISPFIGRLDDIGEDGMVLLENLINIIDFYGYETQIIAASIRHPLHVTQAALLGSHIATVPYPVLKKMFHHPLTTKGIEVFKQDWEKFIQSSN